MDWLRSFTAVAPDEPALACGDRVISYGDLDTSADEVAATLAASGVVPGDRVALWGEGTPATVAAVWGIPRAGAVPVLLGPRLLPAEAMRLTRAAGVRALWGRGPDLDLPRPGRGPGQPPPGHGGPPHPDARCVVFTSGTSGPARPVVLSGGNVAASASGSQRRLENGRGDRWLCVLPLNHVGGLSVLWRSAREGGTVVLEERFEPSRAAALLASGGIAFASLVPVMLRRVLDEHPGPFPGVRAVLVGGGPTDPALLERARRAGLPALQTYGMTETTSQVATESPAGAGRRRGSAGRPLEGFEVRVLGEGGSSMPPGTVGHLEVRGPAVAVGYLDEPPRPPGEWLRTGDLASVDGDGYLFVAGRADDVIVSGGENVQPAEVEAVLREHPGVADVRVYGEPDPEWGRRVVAELVLAPGSHLDPEALAAHARGRLSGFKVPRRWAVVGEIRRGEMGKAGRSGGDSG
jgi:O-succinylbenzoic acid--CoA ligase